MSAAGIVLFAHGSRSPQWREPIEAVAARVRQLAPGTPVLCAYLEHAVPDLAGAVGELVAQGAPAIGIWPLFLGTGRHVREDLPQRVAELQARWPHTAITLQRPIGEHAEVLQAMALTVLGQPVFRPNP